MSSQAPSYRGYHPPTTAYVARRTADGRTKREIIRCLKRFLRVRSTSA